MTRLRRALSALAWISLLHGGDDSLQRVEISKTEHLNFPQHGILRLADSMGDVTVEGWDRSDVEITTVKSTRIAYPAREREKASQELEKIHVEAATKGDVVVITTETPRHHTGIAACSSGDLEVEYRIKAPRDARLVVHHHSGGVYVESLTSDIDVNLRQGEVLLRLPETEKYEIHAASGVGSVTSDFPGKETLRFWRVGHRLANENSSAAHKLNLKVGYGDVIILKSRVPAAPEPVTAVR